MRGFVLIGLGTAGLSGAAYLFERDDFVLLPALMLLAGMSSALFAKTLIDCSWTINWMRALMAGSLAMLCVGFGLSIGAFVRASTETTDIGWDISMMLGNVAAPYLVAGMGGMLLAGLSRWVTK